MDFEIFESGSTKIAEVNSDEVLDGVQDALNLLANVGYYETDKLIIYERNLEPDFFELRSGLAGEILQKCVNYRIQIAIVGEFTKFNSKSLDAFIIECNRGRQIFFVPDRDAAIERLTSDGPR